MNKHIKVIFAIPVIMLLVGAIAYFIVIPQIFGNVVSFEYYFFIDAQSIIDYMFNPNINLPEVHGIIAIQIFWYMWLTGVITSLFFVGKQFQKKSEPDADKMIFTRKESCLIVQNASGTLKQIRRQRNTKELDSLVYAMKCLNEKLSVESDFGYGNKEVIDCENNIAHQLQCISEQVLSMTHGDIRNNINTLSMSVFTINELLFKRMELKKR